MQTETQIQPKQEHSQSSLTDVIQVVQRMNRSLTEHQKLTPEERAVRVSNWLETLEADPILQAERAALDYCKKAIELFARADFDRELFSSLPNRGPALLLLSGELLWLNVARRAIPLIASGAPCVLKAPRAKESAAKQIAEWLRKSLSSSGLPEDFFQLLFGDPSKEDLGETLIEHPAFHQVYWIGRTENALKLRVRLAQVDADNPERAPKLFHYSGSGRNPLILFDGFNEENLDQKIDELARAICNLNELGAYRPTRIFVHDRIYKTTIESLSERIAKLTLKDADFDSNLYEQQIHSALSEGAHLVGSFQPEVPALVRDLTNCSLLQTKELHGPWATCSSFKYMHEVYKALNPSPLGLVSYLCHPDEEKARKFGFKLETSRFCFSLRPRIGELLFEDAAPVKASGQGADGFLSIALGAKQSGLTTQSLFKASGK